MIGPVCQSGCSLLVKTFSNEVSRESLIEFLFCNAERIVDLREWHRARLEPAVENLRNSSEDTLTLL
jgi:hypothetical protein